MAAATSIVSGIKLAGIVTWFSAADAGSSCGRINMSGVQFYPALSRRRFSSIGAVSPILGATQSTFPSSSRV